MTWDECIAACTEQVHAAAVEVAGSPDGEFYVLTHRRRVGLGMGAWTRVSGPGGSMECGVGMHESRKLTHSQLVELVQERWYAGGIGNPYPLFE